VCLQGGNYCPLSPPPQQFQCPSTRQELRPSGVASNTNPPTIWSRIHSSPITTMHNMFRYLFLIRGCTQKFPEWRPGARTANGTALCHYRYFVSKPSEFCRYNALCCFSMNVYCCCLFRYWLSPETFGYTLLSWLFNIRTGFQWG
jgi:hypothetical protein